MVYLRLIVDSTITETPDCTTFFLRNADGTKINYHPGQFLTLVFEHHNEEIRRSYSLSSSPDEPLLSVTVKRIQNGEISRFLLSHIKIGDEINVIAPAGRFLLPDRDAANHLIYFAAGSGIVPIFSHIKYALVNRPSVRISLIYSTRSSEVIFGQQLNNLANQHSQRLSIDYLYSNNGQRLTNAGVEERVMKLTGQNFTNTMFYTCGPFAYMRMVQFELGFLGVGTAQIRKENFVLDTVPVTETTVNFPPRKVRILFGGEWHDIVAGENQSILQAALQNNVRLPYSCRSGICSACFAKCTYGKVEILHNEVLTPQDIADGYVLTCTGHAVTDDVVIEF